jgi:hypothetical protein
MRWPISEPTLRSLERTQGARRGFVQQPSHSDVTRVRRPAGVGQALFDGGSSDVAPDPNPGDATSPTLRHFQELKSAPPRASGFAYACSATKALAGDGPIAVPHTAAQDELRAPLPSRHRRSLQCGSGRLTRPATSGSPPEQTARPKRGWEAGHPLKRMESGANCEDQRREVNSQEPLVSRDFAPPGRWDVTTENRGVPGSSPGLAIARKA